MHVVCDFYIEQKPDTENMAVGVTSTPDTIGGFSPELLPQSVCLSPIHPSTNVAFSKKSTGSFFDHNIVCTQLLTYREKPYGCCSRFTSRGYFSFPALLMAVQVQ